VLKHPVTKSPLKIFALLYKHRDWLLVSSFFAYLAGGVFFLVAIESVFNGGFDFSVRILWLPIAVLIFGFTWFNRHFLYQMTQSRWKTWGTAALAYPVLLLMAWPYVMALNAATSSGEKMIYSGPIQRKWISRGGRGTSYQIDLLDQSTSTVIQLMISPQKYTSVKEGENFTIEFIRGGFGIPYRWRFQRRD
jgi:hypothetical protein